MNTNITEMTFLINAFISWILESLVLHYSIFIYDLFRSIWVLIVFLILFLFSILFLTIKKISSRKKIFVLNFIAIIFIFIVTVVPFIKGEQFRDLEDTGLVLVSLIESYEKANNSYPPNLETLYKQQYDSLKVQMLNDSFEYSIGVDNNKPYFNLEMRPVFIKFSYFYYDKKSHKFLETD